MHPREQAIWGHIWKLTEEKVKQMQPMWFCIISGKQFEDTVENAQWRKVKQMQPMWIYNFLVRQFKDPQEDAHWRKAPQM